jgi:hypothetical protein
VTCKLGIGYYLSSDSAVIFEDRTILKKLIMPKRKRIAGSEAKEEDERPETPVRVEPPSGGQIHELLPQVCTHISRLYSLSDVL